MKRTFAKKRSRPNGIVAKLREAAEALSQRKTLEDVAKSLGVFLVTLHRWRAEYRFTDHEGGEELERTVERENKRLTPPIGDQALDIQIKVVANLYDKRGIIGSTLRRRAIPHITIPLFIARRRACCVVGDTWRTLLGRDGWRVNHKPLRHVWREEGLKVPQLRSKLRRINLRNLGVFASNRRARTRFGARTFFVIEPRMTGQLRRCWTNTRGAISRLKSHAN